MSRWTISTNRIVSRALASSSTRSVRASSRASREDDETNRRRRSTSRASTSSRAPWRHVDQALALGALCAWLRAHGAWTRARETTTFARSTARGVGGVATRDLDEGEVRAMLVNVLDAFFVYIVLTTFYVIGCFHASHAFEFGRWSDGDDDAGVRESVGPARRSRTRDARVSRRRKTRGNHRE